MLLGKSLPSVAQQLLCACISAVMRLHNTCCAHATQVLGGLLGNGVWSLWYYQWRLIGSSDAV